MHRKLAFRRPSAAMAVALIALFVALGGAGYAQLSLPAGSVGTAQLQNNAVSSAKLANGAVGNFKLKAGSVGPRKLMNNSVGIDQINAEQVQSRVVGSCQGAGAIATIATSGNVTCASTPPQEFGAATTTPVALDPGAGDGAPAATTIVSKVLPAGSSYLLLLLLLFFSVSAMALQQLSFQKGRAIEVTPAFAATSVLLPVATGRLVFVEQLSVASLVALLFILPGVVLLGARRSSPRVVSSSADARRASP